MDLTDLTAQASNDKRELRARWVTPAAVSILEQVTSALREARPWAALIAQLPRGAEVENGRDLRGAPLGRFTLEGIDLRDCALGFAELDRGRFSGTDFRGSELAYATLTAASLTRANFEACLMPFARLDRASLVEAVLVRAVLSGASLVGADCSRADLRGAILMGTVTDGAILDDALVEGARFLKFAPP
jgi:hypothetical protein